MRTLATVQDAFDCAADATPSGWIAALRQLPDADQAFFESLTQNDVRLRPGKAARDWAAQVAATPRRLVLLTCEEGAIRESALAEAERLEEPAVCGGAAPAVAWSHREQGQWRLSLRVGGQTRAILGSGQPILSPAVARSAHGLIVAACLAGDGGEMTVLWDESGRRRAAVPGRRPRLLSTPDDRVLLVVEQAAGGRVRLALFSLGALDALTEIPVPRADAFNFNAHLVACPNAGAAYLAWESCPAFGLDERVGLHRDLNLWVLPAGSNALAPAPGSANGFVTPRPEAFFDYSAQNLAPVLPRVTVGRRGLILAYRRFRLSGHKSFGWDAWLTRLDGDLWTPPSRVSPNAGPPDAAWAILPHATGLAGFFPSCRHAARSTFEQEAAGAPRGDTMPIRDMRVEVVDFEERESLPAYPTPPDRQAIYVIPPSLLGVCPEPAPLPTPPRGLSLAWG
ncbi:MAG TPA: hypothetical protein P5137_12905, partial [Candidatus Brocadiia bacterium]|nr:hypothetical protein [Candidatus Brocadiia bacterium]